MKRYLPSLLLLAMPCFGISTSATLPKGTVGTAYSAAISASGGCIPYQWTIASGALAITVERGDGAQPGFAPCGFGCQSTDRPLTCPIARDRPPRAEIIISR